MATPPPTRARAYQCAICQEQYSRPDHLIRHVRTHTKQRPFVCGVCTKAFSRRDLLKRHAQAHGQTGREGTDQDPDVPADQGRYGPRVQQACRSCAAKKLKCTDSKPCRRCTEKRILCEYGQSPEPQPEQLATDMDMSIEVIQPNDDLSPIARSDSSHGPQVADEDEAWPPVSGACDSRGQATIAAQSDEPSEHIETVNPGMSMLEFNTGALEHNDELIDATNDVLGLTFDFPSFGDFIQQEAAPDFEHVNIPFLSDFITTPAAQSVNNDASSSTTLQSTVLGYAEEIYQRSHVHKGWNPGPEDASPAESLELPSNARSEVLSTSRNRSLKLRNDDLTLSTRDRLLAMIYTKTSKMHWRQMSSTFESIDVLKSIIHHALLHMQDHRMIPFLHLPSFDLNAQQPELLGALVAYGAVSLPSAEMRKFGYGLQELVRRAIYQKIEDEPASLQEIGITQAYYIQLYLGYWSAISPKIEVAEGGSMLGATILRRRKMLRAENYKPAEAFLSMESLSIQDKWAKWIEQESRIRLVYYAMLSDAEVSLARNLNPLFSYSEIATPLPTATKLWEAATANEWHDILIHNSSLRLRQPLPIKRLLREPELIRVEKDIVDTTAAAAAMLAGYWALIHEYRQIDSVHCTVQDWNNFVLNSRRQELISFLDQLRMELTELEGLPVQVILLQELVQLHLYAAYYEITVCFGRGTLEEAQAAKPYVEWWCGSQQARHAIVHAGQIFRFIKDLRPGALLDTPVIALYHAMEILWVWGLMHRTQYDKADSSKLLPVFLDGDESPAVAKFLRMSLGHPGVSGPSERFLPLVEPALVSDLANTIIKTNWGTQLQPWTTSEVSRLVKGFSRIYRERPM